jgi:hypothetical protein
VVSEGGRHFSRRVPISVVFLSGQDRNS